MSAECYRIRRRDTGAPSITQDRYRPGSAAARFTALGHVEERYQQTPSYQETAGAFDEQQAKPLVLVKHFFGGRPNFTGRQVFNRPQ